MTIYDIDEEIRKCEKALWDSVDEETGEITDVMMAKALQDRLEQLDIERDKKIEGACLMRQEALRNSDAINNEIKRLKKLKTHEDRRANSLKNYVTFALGGKKFGTDKVSVSYRTDQVVNVINEKALPDDYIRVRLEPNRDAIKKAIKGGEVVPGAALIDSVSTIIK